MIESLRTTQIAFFRFATPCGFFRGSGDEVQKVSVQGFVPDETICENIVSLYQTLMSSLPRMTVFRHRRPKTEFMTGPHRQPSNDAIMQMIDFFHVLVTIPQVSAKVNSIQFPSRFFEWPVRAEFA